MTAKLHAAGRDAFIGFKCYPAAAPDGKGPRRLIPDGRLLLLGVLLGGRTAVGPVRALEVVEQRRELLPARHLGTHALHALDRILPLLPREVHGLERMRLGVVTRRARVLV